MPLQCDLVFRITLLSVHGCAYGELRRAQPEPKKIERASRLLRCVRKIKKANRQLGSGPNFLPEEHRRLFFFVTSPLFAIVHFGLVSQTAAVR